MNIQSSPKLISLCREVSQPKPPTVVVAVDGQNISLWKTGDTIFQFASMLGVISLQWVYDACRKVKPIREICQQNQGWQFIDVADCTKNELDRRMMADCRRLCASHPPDILVLVTNDKDFAPLVEDVCSQGVKVVVIGRRNGMSQRLKRLLPNDIIYIEDLQQLPLAS